MDTEDFEIFQSLLKKTSGLAIGEDKVYLLESRLRTIVNDNGLASLKELASKIKMSPTSELAWAVVEAMTTNETSFFRDNRPFNLFKDVVMPAIMQKNQATKHVRIWSAACSSGQEAYSLAMIIKEQGWEAQGWKFEIIGTDISQEIVNTAKEGIYSQFEVQRGLPIQMLMKYFSQENEKWKLSDTIKSMVQYRTFNLLEPMSLMGKFDIVFCRNVLIYFDRETKGDVLDRIEKITNSGGYLFLGGAETILGVTDRFVAVDGHRGLYQPDKENGPGQFSATGP